ncbi:putative damage-inducible protein DinB [Paenibacillus endophyticus]|uniref:Putative damage-inducible protein DinB n=1 Tax=Paenibacillus endophyticus TaxID=1294268 RepID=A0A7W5C6K7_9BACL|nr:DinB family protein [Paenibacillus endophyticus]MBB3151867.1 putative damage-inducible protein DinB [Paenibacillus endophyticus]
MDMTIEAIVKEWEKEAALTSRVLQALTDDSLLQRIIDDRRTLGELAWHLVTSVQYMRALGLDFKGVDEGADGTDSAYEIALEYQRINKAMLQAVQTQWTDSHLHEKQVIAGEEWRNGESIQYSILHQAHHRGQMTVLMRQAGLVPPELYGPTYETWADKGMKPLK